MSIYSTPYPHMLKEDAEVWLRWLDRYADKFSMLEYDVRVGTGRDPGPAYSDTMRRMAIGLSQRRIDCVAYRPGEIHILEVTRVADMKCLGQIHAYPILYQITYEPRQKLISAVVAQTLGTDVLVPYRRANVTVYLV